MYTPLGFVGTNHYMTEAYYNNTIRPRTYATHILATVACRTIDNAVDSLCAQLGAIVGHIVERGEKE